MSDTPSPPSEPPPHRRCTSCGARMSEDQSSCKYCGTPTDTTAVPAGAFCAKCGYALSGLRVSDLCPECAHPVLESIGGPDRFAAETPIPTSVPTSALCRGCGYSLTGLQVSDICPECSRPVIDSVRGDLLQYCDAAYLQSLHRGAVLVQSGLILQVIATFFGAGAGVLTGAGFGVAAQTIGSLVGLIPAVVSIIGWLIISTPDPGVSLEDKGDKPRKRLRIAAMVNTGAALAAGVLGAFSPGALNFAAGSGPTAMTGNTILQGLAGAATIAAFIAFVIQFFAAMKYLHWLAPRIPNGELDRTMKKQTWTIALLYFPGCALCIGPLISLVLFYNLLDKFRQDFKRIRIATHGNAELWKELLPIGLSTPSGPNPPAQPPNSGGTN